MLFHRIGKYTVFIVSLGFITWQLLTPVPEVQVGGNDKLVHAAAFAWLSLTTHMAFYRQYRYWMIIAVLLCSYGLATETIQYFVPGRSFSWLDWVADCFGVLVAYPLFIYILGLVGCKFQLD
ncbi:MAG: VanZ family protein [Saprospiraceae bacterium]|jgi:VanZ family protein